MAQLSYITTGAKQSRNTSLNIPTDESIGAFLFDISGFKDPFKDYPLLYSNFKDNQIQCIKNLDEGTLLGIQDDGFLNGVFYYHLSQFYDFVERDQTVYIVIADCSKDWDVVQNMQREVSGKLFHIGVWTSQPLWRRKTDGSIGFTPLISDLQAQADEINGKIGVSTHSMIPLHIALCGNSAYIDEGEINYKNLPNAIELNCPKISVFLTQNGSDTIHQIQKNNPLNAPVSALGFIMGCLSVCGVEESIASLESCDLNKKEGFNNPEWGVGKSGTPNSSVNKTWANIIASRGYIIPIDYDGIEASYFFSSDQTLCEGDYSCIANNRVMHKCRRALGTALIPNVNGDFVFMPGSKNISPSSIAMITDAINTIMDSVMRNKKGNKQIDGRVVTFLENPKMLQNDSLSLRLDVLPANYSGYISEEVSHDIV